jgi:hypothetical protein
MGDGGGTRVLGDWEESWRKGCHWGEGVLEELDSLDDGGGTRVLGGLREGLEERVPLGEGVGGDGLPGRWRWNPGP